MLKTPALGPTSLANPNQEYAENRFSKKDYRKLYDLANSSYLKTRLITTRFRDKRFQRNLLFPDLKKIFYCEYNQIPLYINPTTNDPNIIELVKDIARWRLTIHK